MATYISEQLRQQVMQRARFRCEYCLLHRDDEPVYTHEVDHTIAEKHFGKTELSNLAYACFFCNRYKGTDIASVDPLTLQVTPLFNPRKHLWSEHFFLDGALIVPLTDSGRATVRLLQMNRDRILQRRTYLIQIGRYP